MYFYCTMNQYLPILKGLNTPIWQTLLRDFNRLYNDPNTDEKDLINHPILRDTKLTPPATQ